MNTVLPVLSQELGRSPTVEEIAVRCEASPEEILDAMEALPEEVDQLRIPLLVIAGSADPIVPADGSRDIAGRAGSADKESIIYEGHVHELINEPLEDREKVTQDIVDWLLVRTAHS